MVRSVANGVLIASLGSLCCVLAQAQAPRRIPDRIGDSDLYTVVGNTKPMLALAQDEGSASEEQVLHRLEMHFALTDQQQRDLQDLLRQQQTRGSSQFHKFLSPEEYGTRFGPNPQDVAQVTAWLAEQGFSNVQVARSRMFVTFEGNVGQAQAAFHTQIHRYLLNGENHYANTSDPELPKAFEGVIATIRGLHDFKMKPHGIEKMRRHFTSSVSGNHFLTPGDFAVIYNVASLYQSGVDGTGVRIAIAGQSNIQLSDIRAFRSAAGLPANDPQILLAGSDPGLSSSGDQLESDLDVEWAGAIAPNATIILVTSPNVSTSITYAIDNNVAPILSISYGSCEANTGSAEINTDINLYNQANAQGITVIAASGDSGAADCDRSSPARRGLAVDAPASLPNVTGIGGTTFNEGSGNYWSPTNDSSGRSALSYIPEVAWNDSGSSNGLSASGGGASAFVSKPGWQTGTGVPNDGARDVPDLSFSASANHDGYLVCSNGGCVNGFRNTDNSLDVVGGTSAGSPVFAGILALLEQSLGPQGNVNPDLYTLARISPDAFHDVTSGNNIVACQVGTPDCTTGTMGFSAGPGYDQVTGLGSVDTVRLVSAWSGLDVSAISPSQGPLTFVPITPCRVADTRNAPGAFGGPQLWPKSIREFDIPASGCGIPASAVAYALNYTVVPNGPLQYLSTWPTGQTRPLVSTLNSDGRIKANAAIIPAGLNGGVEVYVTDATHLVLDINGYFVPSSSSTGLQFFPIPPCRVADTREANGSLGGPFLAGGQSRDFPVLASSCNVPGAAQAYSLNVTVVPRASLLYLTAWPSGAAQPLASVLNAPNGTTTANAAIIQAGTGGSVSAYASNDTDLVIDINGYFAPPSAGGTNLYTVAPCRVLDTRNPAGSPPTSGTTVVKVGGSGCGASSNATAYVLNSTVVPAGPLAWQTLWADEQPQPFVSTLNADPGVITSNMAIVPNVNGSIDSYATGLTYLIFDISGFFAP